MPPRIKVTADQIVTAAYEIARKAGVEAVTAKAVATELSCSTQPIYWSFSSIEDLRETVRKKANETYNEFMRREVLDDRKYLVVGINYIEFARIEPKLFEMLYMNTRNTIKPVYESRLDDSKDSIVQMVSELSGLSLEKANQLYVDMWIFTHGIAVMIVTKTAQFSDEVIYEMLVTSYKGILHELKEEV